MKQLRKPAYRAIQELPITSPLKIAPSVILGTAITIFGIYSIHQQADITGGGILRLTLLFRFWSGVSSSILLPVLDALNYALGFRSPGKKFLKISIFTTIRMVEFSRLWKLFPLILPSPASYPPLAALAGRYFTGTGCGLVVRQGASCAGDDILALIVSKATSYRISGMYLLTDASVLVLSLSCIPAGRIIYSLITVTASSFIVDFVQNLGTPRKDEDNGKETAVDNERGYTG